MKCLRCDSEMKQYKLEPPFVICGAEHKPHPFLPKQKTPHNLHSVYICDECGYAEFSTKYCDNPDV